MSLQRAVIHEGEPSPRPAWCSGALLVVTWDEYLTLQRDGLRWVTPAKEIDRDGRTSARVYCAADESRLHKHGVVYAFGLCGACMELEQNQRRDLRERSSQGSR